MITGLENQGCFSHHSSVACDLRDLLLTLKTISEKELTNQPLSGANTMPSATWPDARGHRGIPAAGVDRRSRLVLQRRDAGHRRCAYRCNTGRFLEEGVGYPLNIYVICNVEGELIVARGAVFSYYEIRLADEWTV